MRYGNENQTTLKTLEACGYTSIEEAYPHISPIQLGIEPLGSYLLVQMRMSKQSTAGGLILVSDTKEFDQYQNVLAKVIALGPLAFKNRTTAEEWPEGKWADVDDYVYVPKYTHNSRQIEYGDEQIELRFVKDTDLIAKVSQQAALSLKAYV